VHGNSKPLFVDIVVGTGSVGGRFDRRIFESSELRARFAAARSASKLQSNKSAAART
jgi:hypothetical protein